MARKYLEIPALVEPLPPTGTTGARNTEDFTGEGCPLGVSVTLDWNDFTILHTLGPRGEKLNLSGQPVRGADDPAPATPEYVIRHILRLDPAEFDTQPHGFRFYRKVLKLGDIRVCSEGAREGMGVHVSMTGGACRVYEMAAVPEDLPDGYQVGEEPVWSGLIRRVFQAGGHFTRLDLALDDMAGYIQLARVRRHIAFAHGYTVEDELGRTRVPRRVRTLFRDIEPRGRVAARAGVVGADGHLDERDGMKGDSVVFGSTAGKVLVRFYDKRLEQKVTEDRHWVRVETQMRDERANEAAKLLLKMPAGEVAGSILQRYISFVSACKARNFARWPQASWWTDFIGVVRPVRLTVPLQPITVERSVAWLENATPASMALALENCGGDIDKFFVFCLELAAKGYDTMSGRHKAALKHFYLLKAIEGHPQIQRTSRYLRCVISGFYRTLSAGSVCIEHDAVAAHAYMVHSRIAVRREVLESPMWSAPAASRGVKKQTRGDKRRRRSSVVVLR